MSKLRQNITGVSNWVVRLAGCAILFVLTWYSMRFTQYMTPLQGYEYPVERRDSVVLNLSAAALVTVLVTAGLWAQRRVGEGVKKWICRGALAVSVLWQGVWGSLWIAAADRCPKGDQESVYKAACAFLRGDYHALGPRGYCEIYPHQLGLASFEELLFKLTGRADYHMIQWIFVAMIMGEVCFVYGLLKEVSAHETVVAAGTLMAGSCMATVFYTAWVYGEVPLVFFSLLAARMAAAYLNRGSKKALAGFLAAVTFAALARKNALILIAAFALTGAVTAWVKRDRKLLVAVILAVLIPNLCYSAIFKMYELRSGYEHADGLPANGYIYIGIQETEGRYGWDYLDSNKVYYENGRDTARTRKALDDMIAERLGEMGSRPGYLPAFMKGKILSQWNAPLYQSMYFNYVHEEVHWEGVTAFLDRLSGDLFEALLRMADRLQFVIYFGTLLYFILCVRPGGSPLRHLPAVTVIGGFLFSILWEAKTRYVFPYYMLMFPLAAQGYGELAGHVLNFFKKKDIMTP